MPRCPRSKIDGKIARHLDRDDMVSNTINTFVSLTIQCAQCHNHKFDPITQEDYYRLQAVFAALDRADRPYHNNIAAAHKSAEMAKVQPAGLVYAGTVHNGGGAAFRGTGPDGGKPRPIFVLRRGDVRTPGQEVGPSALNLLADLPGRFELSAGHTEGDRRAALARWLTDPPQRAGLAVDRQPGLAVPLRPGDRRHAQRLRPDGPVAHPSRAARLAGRRVSRRRSVAQGAAPADRHLGRPTGRPRRATPRPKPPMPATRTSGG